MTLQNETNLFSSDFLKFDSCIYQIFNGFSRNSISLKSNFPIDIQCPICYSVPKIPTRPNKCTHIFCFGCISKWLNTKRTCPYCRTTIDKLIKI